MIGIVGGGISGLIAAWELDKRGIPYMLFEATGKVGGMIQTLQEGPYLMELGPNSLLVDADLLKFIEEDLGLSDEIIHTKDVSSNRFIVRKGRIQKVPSGPIKLLGSKLLSWKSKRQVLKSLRAKPTKVTTPDESLASYFERHFSREIVDYFVSPFVAGIYSGDSDELLVKHTFPQLHQFEESFGSPLKGLMKSGSTHRKQTISFKHGLGRLPQSIASTLSSLKLHHRVTGIQSETEGVELIVEYNGQETQHTFDSVIMACDYNTTQSLLPEAPHSIDTPPIAALHTAFKKEDLLFPIHGFGALVPAREGFKIAGSIWSSSIFDFRCPQDEVLLTTFIGGRLGESFLDKTDEEVILKAIEELRHLYKIKTKTPLYHHFLRWDNGIPQYTREYDQVIEWGQQLQKRQIYPCANWYGGVSIPDRIKEAQDLVKQISQF